uniref:GPI mannosyltransferase 2 n=2 Tax=Aegilops tauschii subsp. strangulata TaxID=200361 RepID=A0A453CYQ0_AEGTS
MSSHSPSSPSSQRLNRSTLPVPVRAAGADAGVQGRACDLRACSEQCGICCRRGLFLQIICADLEGLRSGLPCICSFLLQSSFCVLLITVYSESLYALFSLGGLFYLFSGARTVAMIMLALSGSARSNGALNAGYICFEALLQAYDAAIQKKRPMALVTGFLRSTFVFLPFFAFQAYGYLNICVHGDTDELRPWCKAKLPLLYSFIQSHYWGVGFLRYFQVKQLPNFLLASPALSLAVYSIVHYTKLLHQLFQSTSIHEQIIAIVDGRLVEAHESSDVATVLKSEISTGLHNKKQGYWRTEV